MLWWALIPLPPSSLFHALQSHRDPLSLCSTLPSVLPSLPAMLIFLLGPYPLEVCNRSSTRDRIFLKQGVPCIMYAVSCPSRHWIQPHQGRTPTFSLRYNGHYFVSTLLFSIFLGYSLSPLGLADVLSHLHRSIFGADRYCLGHIGLGMGKLFTLGRGVCIV